MKNLGAQLYTVREYLKDESEIKNTLSKIKQIGYASVQLFGSAEFAEVCAKGCKEVGIEIAGVLSNLGGCEAEEKKLFEICEKYNIPDIGVSTNFAECQEPYGYVERINAFSAKAKAAGFSFSYHNHAHEFIRIANGEIPMQIFMKGFNAETVDFMPDTYWLQDGGYDVRYFLEQTKGRVKILHLKDMKRTEQGHMFAEVGSGSLWFEGIIKTALDAGTQYFVVEQDICEKDPFESMKQSYDYTKRLLED